MLTVVWTIIRKARNHCQDVDHCRDKDDHCQTGNRCQDRDHCQNGNEHADGQNQWYALKYN